MKSNMTISFMSYFSILSLFGGVFFSLLFFKIIYHPPFLKLNYKKIMENRSDISIFVSALFFFLCFYLCIYYQNKLKNINDLSEKEELNKKTFFNKKDKNIIFIKRRDLLLKNQYMNESCEKEEKKTLINSLEDNDNL